MALKHIVPFLPLIAQCMLADPPETLSESEVRRWGPSQGLPEETVHSVSETPDGYLWLASRDGLIRFDGANFRVFRPGEAAGSNDNGLAGALVMGNSLWVGGSDYVAYATPDSFQSFTNLRFRAATMASDPEARYGGAGMQALADGTLFFRRADAVYRTEARVTSAGPAVPQLYLTAPAGQTFTGFYHGPAHDWAATASGIYTRRDGQWVRVPSPQIRSATIVEASNGVLWALSHDGLFAYDGVRFRRFELPGTISTEPFRALFEDREGDIWVGLVGAIGRVRGERVDVLPLGQVMRTGDFVKVIFQSRDGALWAATNWGSLVRVDSPVFHAIGNAASLGEVAISAVVRDGKGRTWIGTRTKGIFTHDGEGFHRVPATDQGILHAMLLVGERQMLYANVVGVWLSTPNGSRLLAAAPSQIINRYRSFSINYGTHVYYADSQTIYRIPLPIHAATRFERIADVSSVRSIIESDDGIWAVSSETGLHHISRAGTATRYPFDKARELRGFTLFALSSNHLLVGSSGGVLLFDRRSRRYVDGPPLFAKDQIFQIISDGKSHLWFAGRRALLTASLETMLEYANGRRPTVLPLRLTGEQGLTSTNYGLGTSSVGTFDTQGTMWLASIGGVIHFRPDEVVGLNENLPCAIDNVMADGVPLAVSPSITLPTATRRVEVHYTALNRKADRNPIFRYRLEGEDWVETSLFQADFTNLSPGVFKFQVQARLASQEWSAPTTMEMSITPEWFQRTSVHMAGLGLSLLVLFLTVQLRSRRITARNVELEEHVRARTKDLAQARDEAESAGRAKAEFLASMSHEVRTPMNGVIGMIEVLKQTPLNAEQRQIVSVVSQSGEALIGILNDILDFSKIEAGALTLESVPFNLRELVQQCYELFSAKAHAKALAFDVEIDPALPVWVRGDSTRVRQILLNLLSNALKFTHLGRVGIRVQRADPGELAFVVSDTGIGIPADKTDSIFSAFTQAETSTTRRFGGTGLGLSISQRLAMAMQGTLQVRSVADEGSTFTLTLPLAAAEAPSVILAAPPNRSTPYPSPRRILVVEDNSVNRQVASRLLANLGCDVTLANDGEQGVAAAAAGAFDVILMDCHMPIMDGYEATRQIRSLLGMHGAPHIVALTASAQIEDRRRCLDVGMNGFLTKPIRSNELREMLDSLPARVD